MIIVDGYHDIILYESEMHPHDLRWYWYCQTQPFRRCHFFGRQDTHQSVQIHKWCWWLPTADLQTRIIREGQHPSSVLSQRHTTVTPLFDTLLLGFKKCVFSTLLRHLRCERITFAKLRQIKSTHTLLLKFLWYRHSLRFVALYDLNLMGLKSSWMLSPENAKTANPPKNPTDNICDQVFPELQYFLKSDLHQNTFYTLLKETPTLNRIASMHMTHLANLLKVNLIDTLLKSRPQNQKSWRRSLSVQTTVLYLFR